MALPIVSVLSNRQSINGAVNAPESKLISAMVGFMGMVSFQQKILSGKIIA